MSLLRKKKWWRQTVYRRFVIVCIVALCILLAFSVFDRYQIERDMAERRMAVEEELVELQARKASLEEKVQYLRDERGVEAEIRKHFDVAREGEQVVVLIDDERNTSDEVDVVESTTPEKSGWTRFLPW